MASRTRVLQSSLAAVLMIGAAALTLSPAEASAFSMGGLGNLARTHSSSMTDRSDVAQGRTTTLGRLGGLKTDSAPKLSTGGATKPVQLADGPTRQLPKTDSMPSTPRITGDSDAPKLTDNIPSKPTTPGGDKASGGKASSDGKGQGGGKGQKGGKGGKGGGGGQQVQAPPMVQRFNDPDPIVHRGKHQWAKTLHIRAKDGSNTLVHVQITATPGVTASYDPASQTVTGYGGPGTITITGEVETLDGNVPFVWTIDVK